MAKSDNLVHYLTDIANAIREKNGTSDLINAQDFADEIKNGGNSGGGGDSSWKYFKIKQDADFSDGGFLYDVYRSIVMSSFFLILGDDGYGPYYGSAFTAWEEKNLGGKLIAVGFDTEQYALDVFDSWENKKIGDLLNMLKADFMEYLFEKEISKEEYYQLHTLNWN